MPSKTATGAFRRSREEREAVILDTAQDLFYARGVHEVGMDELVAATGLGKASVYRLYPTKDALVGAYLQRLATTIFAEIDAVQERHAGAAAPALLEILDAVEHDIRRPGFRGCAFNNASIEFDDRDHPARAAARSYRGLLDTRLRGLSVELAGRAAGEALGDQLAVLIDGAYTNAAHLGPDGPATAGLGLARELVQSHSGGRS